VEKETEGCVKPARGPLVTPAAASEATATARRGEGKAMQARVGSEAPDFEATAFVGDGFANVRLSEHRGKWIVLCFYPGDFTFV
jgi:AhpC/TSA family